MNRSFINTFSPLIFSLSLAACTGVTDELSNLTLGTTTDVATSDSVNSGTNLNIVRSAACAELYNGNLNLVSGQDHSPILTTLAKPNKAVSRLDPTYGTCMTRVTDFANEEPSGFARNDYSRRQAFNADESYILSYAKDGYWHLYDATDFSHIRKLSLGGGSVEPQWHPTNPDLLYKFPNNGGLSISTHNVLTDQTVTVAQFTNVASINGHPGSTSIRDIWPTAARVWTKAEGSPSKDARYWGLQVETSDFKGLGAITYDLQNNVITGVFDFADNGIGRPDHISMSPSGDYVVPSWHVPNECATDNTADLGTTNNPCGLMSYTRDFSHGVGLAKKGPHSDTAIDANGNDVIVISNYDSGFVESLDLATGQATNLWSIYQSGSATAMHVSGKAYNKPGWVLISTYATTNSNQWYTDKIMAVEIAANPRIYNIAHTYNSYSSYWTEPHAVVNRDFTKVLFNSNWGSGAEDIDTYMIELPVNTIN